MHKLALIACVLAGCGGHKPADTTPTETTTTSDTPPPPDTSGNMIAPEKMDEVQQDLGRKQMIVSHCLATAMEAGEVKRGAHGKVALEIVIDPSGKVDSAKVIKTDIDAKSVTDCVIKHVEDIAFPELPKRYETSYTYAMEAN